MLVLFFAITYVLIIKRKLEIKYPCKQCDPVSFLSSLKTDWYFFMLNHLVVHECFELDVVKPGYFIFNPLDPVYDGLNLSFNFDFYVSKTMHL